jgi:GMP synthase (glutamine-hydrolysing)
MINDKVSSIELVKVYNDEMPKCEPGNIWIITGSRYSVYDDISWIKPFIEAIKKAIDLKVPMLGICFGHQIICNALGATVTKNSMGWELGSSDVRLTKKGSQSALFNGFDHRFSVYQSHQDIVTDVPDSVDILAENKYGVQSVSFNDIVFGVQFHPEFSFDVMKAYYSIRIKKINSKDRYFVSRKNNGIKVIDNFLNKI